jgi:hypothetical protein
MRRKAKCPSLCERRTERWIILTFLAAVTDAASQRHSDSSFHHGCPRRWDAIHGPSMSASTAGPACVCVCVMGRGRGRVDIAVRLRCSGSARYRGWAAHAFRAWCPVSSTPSFPLQFLLYHDMTDADHRMVLFSQFERMEGLRPSDDVLTDIPSPPLSSSAATLHPSRRI